MCREDPKLRISAADACVRFLWLSASLDLAEWDDKLISTRKRGVTQRVVRKLGKKLHVRTLLGDMRLRDDASSTNPSPSMSVSWLPVYSL